MLTYSRLRALALTILGLICLSAAWNPLRAVEATAGEPALCAGEHYGMWHADEAKFTIDKVDDHGKFTGRVELLDGVYRGDTFAITGETTCDGGIEITRTGLDQVSKAEAPELEAHHFVWRGKTYIAATNAKLLFELRLWNPKQK